MADVERIAMANLALLLARAAGYVECADQCTALADPVLSGIAWVREANISGSASRECKAKHFQRTAERERKADSGNAAFRSAAEALFR